MPFVAVMVPELVMPPVKVETVTDSETPMPD